MTGRAVHGRYQTPCGHPAAGASGATACGVTPTRLYIQGHRCRDHTPSAVRGLPEPPEGRCAPARCHCGRPRCHAYETFGREAYALEGGAAWTAIDAPAIVSGKRRASPQDQAAARATVAEQRDRDATLRSTPARKTPNPEPG